MVKDYRDLRNNSLNTYGLCTSYYLSTSGLSWDAMLQMTKIEFELISGPDICIFFQKVARV